MIDCNITINYLLEKKRMTQKGKICEACYGHQCPLGSKNNGIGITCVEFESSYPEKAITIVQKWSDEHPQNTYLTELLKIFPHTPLNDDGTPKGICLHELGATSLDNCEVDNACAKCWNQPIEDDESK